MVCLNSCSHLKKDFEDTDDTVNCECDGPPQNLIQLHPKMETPQNSYQFLPLPQIQCTEDIMICSFINTEHRDPIRIGFSITKNDVLFWNIRGTKFLLDCVSSELITIVADLSFHAPDKMSQAYDSNNCRMAAYVQHS